MSRAPGDRRPLRVLLLNWRDTTHPEGGGSERYLEEVARRLVLAGDDVTLLCAEHGDAPSEEVRGGVRILRRGGRLGVYGRGLAHLLGRRRSYDVVVDVQNGVPFWSALVSPVPVVVLVHHVHREVWPVAVGPVAARVGWWLESRVAPVVQRRCRYIAVSESTRTELAALGVDPARIDVVRGGTEAWEFPGGARVTGTPAHLCVVGRLVPHKQVEHAIDAVAAIDEAVLDVIGHGYWEDRLRAHAVARGVQDRVVFHGYLTDAAKHQVLAGALVHLCPSLKEGWGLVCIEAARHGVPTVAYRSAGGVGESVRDGRTGVLVDGAEQFTAAVVALVSDPARAASLGAAGRAWAGGFSWEQTARGVRASLDRARREHPERRGTRQPGPGARRQAQRVP